MNWSPSRPSTLLVCGLTLAFAQGCTLSGSPANSPPQVAPLGAPLGAVDTSPGARLQVARNGQWYGATVVQALPDGRVVIHYDNAGNEFNEAVGPDRIRPLPGAGPARDYHAGERVLVTYQGRLLLANVESQIGADLWRVHYDGFGPEAGENVGPDRLRRPYAGSSAHAVGEALIVEVNGQALPARVLALSAPDKWLVRFDNYGPQYDQEIGQDRLRPVPGKAGPPPAAAAMVAPPAPPAAAAPPVVAVIEKPVEKPKPKPAGDAGLAPQAGPPAVGEVVLVHQHGAWFTATVAEVAATGVKVKFAAGGEATAGADHVLREPASLRGAQYVPGQQVLVEYKGIYVPGKILRAEGKDYKVRFDGVGPAEDEVIAVRRLRPR